MHRNNKNSAYDLTEIPDFQQPLVRPCEYLKSHVDERRCNENKVLIIY